MKRAEKHDRMTSIWRRTLNEAAAAAIVVVPTPGFVQLSIRGEFRPVRLTLLLRPRVVKRVPLSCKVTVEHQVCNIVTHAICNNFRKTLLHKKYLSAIRFLIPLFLDKYIDYFQTLENLKNINQYFLQKSKGFLKFLHGVQYNSKKTQTRIS